MSTHQQAARWEDEGRRARRGGTPRDMCPYRHRRDVDSRIARDYWRIGFDAEDKAMTARARKGEG